MSHLLDYLCKSEAGEDLNKFMELEEEMNNLDIPMQFDSSELMVRAFIFTLQLCDNMLFDVTYCV